MAKTRKVNPVNLFIGIIYGKEVNLLEIEDILIQKFGKIDLISDDVSFDWTDYYFEEIGSQLCKRFYSFESMIDPIFLADVKLFTNDIEKKYSVDGNRIFNLDPGYLDLPKVVLASAKDFAHRIYVGKGIFAEITLSFINNNFKFLPWTYSDYKSEQYLKFFYELRQIYKNKLAINLEEQDNAT